MSSFMQRDVARLRPVMSSFMQRDVARLRPATS
jgi:hypothetical protein